MPAMNNQKGYFLYFPLRCAKLSGNNSLKALLHAGPHKAISGSLATILAFCSKRSRETFPLG